MEEFYMEMNALLEQASGVTKLSSESLLLLSRAVIDRLVDKRRKEGASKDVLVLYAVLSSLVTIAVSKEGVEFEELNSDMVMQEATRILSTIS